MPYSFQATTTSAKAASARVTNPGATTADVSSRALNKPEAFFLQFDYREFQSVL